MMINLIKSAFKQNKLAIYSSIVILFGSMLLGYLFQPYLFDFFNPVVEDFTQKVQTGVIQLTFADVFSNNIRIVFQMFIYGVLCCFSAVILAFNGFFTGYYIATTGDVFTTMMLIIPHGIFEFSSCILACTSGFVLFNFIYRFIKLFAEDKSNSIVRGLYTACAESYDKLIQACILLVISAVLMVIAGFIEVYLTLPIAEFIISFIS